ncbi:hypothetical protein BM221_006669 [Beauveria bassiana]|uniref:Uncharacterized protein n=1 Tax=Beauveria bassiana TaxID=176275 RepID=A0A2N6NIA1_BEABA|nr:hypothetical protein BM221_006669 [Beauveria bassiana]
MKEGKGKREIRNDEATLRRGGWDGWMEGWMGGTGAGYGGANSPVKYLWTAKSGLEGQRGLA